MAGQSVYRFRSELLDSASWLSGLRSDLLSFFDAIGYRHLRAELC